MRRLSLILILLLSCSPSSATEADYLRVKNVKKGDFLDVRSDPTENAVSITVLGWNARRVPNRGCLWGKELVAFQRKNNFAAEAIRAVRPHHGWCKVFVDHMEGWVNAQFVEEDARRVRRRDTREFPALYVPGR